MFKPNKFIKNLAFISGVIALSLGLSYAVLAVWQEPTLSPPDGNVRAPINAGSSSQIKGGDLTIQNASNNALLKSNLLSIDGPAVINNMNLSANGLLVPNGNVGIGTASPEFKLSLDNDGGIIAKGTIDSGAALATAGEGSRLIWYPRKGAFRAGYAVNDGWDDANIGYFSAALGFGSRASGDYATALSGGGAGGDASGLASTAIGNAAIASGDYSFAVGQGSIAEGHGSTAIGMGARTTLTGQGSIVLSATSQGNYDQVTVSGIEAIAIGGGTGPFPPLDNNIDHSLMVGFRSNIPTLFVGHSYGAGTTGNVGIGTTNKLSKFTVSASADMTDASGFTRANASTTITGAGGSNDFTSEIGIGDRISLSSAPAIYATVTAIASDTSLTVSAPLGNGTLQTINKKESIFRLNDSSGATQMVVNDQGNVGIGMLTPNAKLDVSGSVLFSGTAEGPVGGITIPNSDILVGGGSDGYFAIRKTNSGKNLIAFGKETADGAAVPFTMALNTSNDRVGIGTVTPSEKLDVNGNVQAAAFLYSSDERLKENIFKISNPLEKILKLNGVSFNWKNSGEKGIGLTAQNVETVFPELVKTDTVSGMKSVEYGNLVAPLVEAMKEQQKTIENLQKEIEALKAEINK